MTASVIKSSTKVDSDEDDDDDDDDSDESDESMELDISEGQDDDLITQPSKKKKLN